MDTNIKHQILHAFWSKDVFISVAWIRCWTCVLNMEYLIEQNTPWCYSSDLVLPSLSCPFWGVVAWHTFANLPPKHTLLRDREEIPTISIPLVEICMGKSFMMICLNSRLESSLFLPPFIHYNFFSNSLVKLSNKILLQLYTSLYQ